MSLENLNAAMMYIRRYFGMMTAARLSQHQNLSGAAQRPDVSQFAAAAAAALKQPAVNTAPLNAQNLQHLQKQEEETLEKVRRASSQANAAAPFGALSPSGAPHAYGPRGFTPEKMRIPPNKRRKGSQAAQVQAEARTEASKQGAQQQLNHKAAGGPFKCSVVECQHHYSGFSSQASLDRHVEETHAVEEPIENALEFALESFRISLAKEDDEKMGNEGQDTKATSVGMQRVVTKGSLPGRLGSKSSSSPPTSSISPGKLPVASVKDEKKEATASAKVQPPTAGESATRKYGQWADSDSISLDAIRDAIEDLSASGDNTLYYNGHVDLANEFLSPPKDEQEDGGEEKEASSPDWSIIATPTGDDDDEGGSDARSWIPSDWINVPSRFEDDAWDCSWEDVDWEVVERRKDAELAGMVVDHDGSLI